VQARSALFDLYGDHLAERGAAAPVAALVRLLAPVSIAAPAVRTAVSRMVRQGWLRPVRLAAGPGYALTPRARRRLDDAAARIYRTGGYAWDGTFDLLVVTAPVPRPARARLTATLSYLGYGALSATTWAAPRQSWSAYRDAETESLLTELSVPAERFAARHAAGTGGAAELVRRAWDLPALAAGYERFLAEHRPMLRGLDGENDEHRYAARFRLVHAWRRFLFTDPQLPGALLPADWPGRAAAEFFDHHATRLRPAADRYVDACLET
jgi:phenylacetic acid degradation operon negative regulatory protein